MCRFTTELPYKTPLCLLFILTLCTTPATAATGGPWFAAFKTSIGDVTIDNITDHGSIGTGLPVGNSIDGQLDEDEADDYTAGIGFAVGRRMGNWNLSAEYIWRYRTDWDNEFGTPAIATITNVFSNIETSSLLFNVARRAPINQNWSWEIGAGIGMVYNDLDSEYIEREIPGVSPELKFKDNSSDTDFSYNVFAGVTRNLGERWTLNVRYRYIDLGELDAGPFPSRPSTVSGDHSSQELQFSFERNF